MKEFIKDIIIALVIVLAITLVIKPTIVKESSMEPTLYENNYLFGNVYRNGVQLEEDYTLEGYTTGELYDYVVPENEVFVMGDNRSVSLDSRSAEVGAVSEDDIIGKAFFRLYPFSEIGLL